MMQRIWLAALAVIFAPLIQAANTPTTPAAKISGSWQGTLGQGASSLRLVFQIRKGERGEWTARLYNIDRSPTPIPASAVTLNGGVLRLTMEGRGSFEGRLSTDGQSLEGTWKSGAAFPLLLHRATKRTAWPLDSSPHAVQFVMVDHDVRLEVLDWGGTGRPLELLSGLGGDAHDFDQFAPKLTPSYHVLGITRRGFGASSVPAAGYSADRLGDDVLEVLAALKVSRPVLVGESIGGEELSSIGFRHPEKVTGLIYLDAGYAYAFYDDSRGDLDVDLDEVRSKLDTVQQKQDSDAAQQLTETDLPRLMRDLQKLQPRNPSAVDGIWLGPGLQSLRVQITVKSDASGQEQCTFDSVDQNAFGLLCAKVVFSAPEFSFEVPSVQASYAGKLSADGQSLSGSFIAAGMTVPLNLVRQATRIAQPLPPQGAPAQAIFQGQRRFPAITEVPILAIFAYPHDLASSYGNEAAARATEERDAAQVSAFERAMPSARVVRLAYANHVVFRSNEADVLREINAFLAGLAPVGQGH
jgi:pimeloyl-ACP methyl ester carboxylesterase